jgi:hypothetical protein
MQALEENDDFQRQFDNVPEEFDPEHLPSMPMLTSPSKKLSEEDVRLIETPEKAADRREAK